MSPKRALEPFEDRTDEGNSEKYHTGKECIEGCGRPAGTAWAPAWCFECNVKRMKKIDRQFNKIVDRIGGAS